MRQDVLPRAGQHFSSPRGRASEAAAGACGVQGVKLSECAGDPVGESGEVRGRVGVTDEVEVQLACVGECADADGDVPLHHPELEYLQHWRAGEKQRGGRAGKSADQQVDQPLPRHHADHPPLQQAGAGLVGGLALALGGGPGDRRQAAASVSLPDRQGTGSGS